MVRVATSTDCEIRETVPVNVCPGYAATVNVNDVPFVTPAVYASGTGIDETQSIALDDPDDRRRRAWSTGRTDQRSRMHIAFGHDAAERGGDPEIPFHVADRLQRLAGRFDVLQGGRDLTLVGLDRLLREDDVIARDDTRRGGRRFQLLVGARGRLGFRADRRQLRLGALQLGLRFGLLRDEFRRLERGQLLACADARTAIHARSSSRSP